MGKFAWAGYLLFLVGYSAYKYSVAAPPEFSALYAQSVAILVGLTGIAPFFLTFAVFKPLPIKRFAASGAGLLLGLLFCVAGYAAFWAVVINPSGYGVPLMEVATRGIGWGLLQGGLAAIAANH